MTVTFYWTLSYSHHWCVFNCLVKVCATDEEDKPGSGLTDIRVRHNSLLVLAFLRDLWTTTNTYNHQPYPLTERSMLWLSPVCTSFIFNGLVRVGPLLWNSIKALHLETLVREPCNALFHAVCIKPEILILQFFWEPATLKITQQKLQSKEGILTNAQCYVCLHLGSICKYLGLNVMVNLIKKKKKVKICAYSQFTDKQTKVSQSFS